MPQEDIRGLKDLIHIPYPLSYWFIGAALAIGLIALAFFLIRKYFKKTPPPKEVAPPQPLHERILKELSELRERYDYTPATEKKFHFLLSEIFRRYLEGRFQFAATDSTTEEILARLPRISQLTESQKEPLARILKGTDEVKFAERHKTREEAHALIGLAETFVRETTPAPLEDGGPA